MKDKDTEKNETKYSRKYFYKNTTQFKKLN